MITIRTPEAFPPKENMRETGLILYAVESNYANLVHHQGNPVGAPVSTAKSGKLNAQVGSCLSCYKRAEPDPRQTT